MTEIGNQLARGYDIAGKVGQMFQKRAQLAQAHFAERVSNAFSEHVAPQLTQPKTPWDAWTDWVRYSTDFAQRAVLFWDTLRQRGNQYVEHERAGLPPVLHFAFEMVLDARGFERPVNYALVRIVPPEGVTVDPTRRPYIIIDPRAGHGPGIGGFKDDSQVGVAIRAGHPVYFVIFFPTPEPGQTLVDVTEAEKRFVHEVRALHPVSPKPVLVGNCQGGWAAMMLAAADPDETGPIVINGAPMSYWGGAWNEGEGDNPMRYSGGLLGGTWLSSFSADLGNGLFDGAYLVQNFENLNPANTYWDKYYNLFAKIDTEPPRFLEFERWWGGHYLLNREEIEWITQNLFVGNDLWSGKVKSATGKAFDLREIRQPIILFASMGDNITPPEQAFNWVADVYGSTEEIKARGQVIIGLLHRDIGHLGIFVSGKVAKKEHAQIVSVMKSIEALPPGLYGMQIIEKKAKHGEVEYDVQFSEHRLEEITERLNRFKRADEKPFEAVAAISEFNQKAYELFAQPLVQSLTNEFTAKISRDLNPTRVQNWAISDLNPWLWWLAPAAAAVQAQRQAVGPDEGTRRLERFYSEVTSASLDYYRAMRDAASEAAFFQTYGNIFSLYLADKQEAGTKAETGKVNPRELPFVKAALASIDQGGYAEALARIGALLARKGEPLPLSQFETKEELIADYKALLPDVPRDAMRRIRGEQDLIVEFERERAIDTLPLLVPDAADHDRLMELFQRVLGDRRMQSFEPTAEQRATVARIRAAFDAAPARPRLAAVLK